MSEILSSDGDKIEIGDLIEFRAYKDHDAILSVRVVHTNRVGLLLEISDEDIDWGGKLTRFQFWGERGLEGFSYMLVDDPTYTLHKLS